MSEHMPCEDLYIYLIEGKVSEGDEIVLGDAFLGNWVEDNSAFLFFFRTFKRPRRHPFKASQKSYLYRSISFAL